MNYHVILQPEFWLSRSVLLILDFLAIVDADMSDFFAEPGITIPLKLTVHFLSSRNIKGALKL